MQSMRESLHSPASNHERELLKNLGLLISRVLASCLHMRCSVRITHIKLTNLLFRR
jgi:hypothetical protein